jgi:hypothetical protein
LGTTRYVALLPDHLLCEFHTDPSWARHLFATLTVSPSRVLLSQAIRIFEDEVQAIKSVDGLVPNLVSYAVSRNAIAAMKQRGGNAIGIEGDGPLLREPAYISSELFSLLKDI